MRVLSLGLSMNASTDQWCMRMPTKRFSMLWKQPTGGFAYTNASPDQCCIKRPIKGLSMLGKQPTGGFAHAGECLQHTFSCTQHAFYHIPKFFPHASQENVYILKVVHAWDGITKDLSLHEGLFLCMVWPTEDFSMHDKVLRKVCQVWEGLPEGLPLHEKAYQKFVNALKAFWRIFLCMLKA